MFMVAYNARLNRDPMWAMEEGGKFFRGQSEVNAALFRITERLESIGVPYALVGGMALFQYGHRRFTEDVDLLINGEDLRKIHDAVEGRGYRPKFPGSKNLRDTEGGVTIEFLIAGEYPGDGKPKPVAFPNPSGSVEVVNGIKCLNLVSLVEMKLASGMTAPERVADFGDVIKLARILALGESFAENLNPYVRAKFKELVMDSRASRRFKLRLDKPVLAPESAAELASMAADGVMEEPDLESSEFTWLVTTDPVVAAKYDMHEESEFMS